MAEIENENFDAARDAAAEFAGTLKRWSLLLELVHDTANMRHFQKKFFREKENPKAKAEYLQESKSYEKKVDRLIEQLWPTSKNQNQTKLF